MSSAPLTADQMLAALAKWGIKPLFMRKDWRTHNRNGKGDGWGPVINGLIVHNFASDISDAHSLDYLWTGDAGRQLPGPLSQFAIDDAGTVWVIGWGRANHGGSGDPGFVDALAYDRLSLTADYKPRTAGSVDMNARTYGVEMLYGKAPTQAQRDSVVRLAAALMDAHGYAATSVGGHRESTTQRSDPTGFQMGPLRSQVAALLKAGPGSTLSKPVATLPKPSNPTPKEDPMPAPKDLWDYVLTGPDGKFKATAAAWLTYANDKADRATAASAAASGKIDGLTELVRQVLASTGTISDEQVTAIIEATSAAAEKGASQALATLDAEVTLKPGAGA